MKQFQFSSHRLTLAISCWKDEPLIPSATEQVEVKNSEVKNLEKELAEIKKQIEEREVVTKELIAKEVGKFMQSAVTVAKQKNSHHIDGIANKKKKLKVKRK